MFRKILNMLLPPIISFLLLKNLTFRERANGAKLKENLAQARERGW